MNEQDLHDALDGLMAYDLGATDSGIHDEQLRRQVVEHLGSLDDGAFRIAIARWMREYLTDEALDESYGVADVLDAARWLSGRMGFDI